MQASDYFDHCFDPSEENNLNRPQEPFNYRKFIDDIFKEKIGSPEKKKIWKKKKKFCDLDDETIADWKKEFAKMKELLMDSIS